MARDMLNRISYYSRLRIGVLVDLGVVMLLMQNVIVAFRSTCRHQSRNVFQLKGLSVFSDAVQIENDFMLCRPVLHGGKYGFKMKLLDDCRNKLELATRTVAQRELYKHIKQQELRKIQTTYLNCFQPWPG